MAEGLELFKNSSKKILSVAGEGGATPIFDDLHAEELSQVWLSSGLPLDQHVHMCMSRAAQVF